MVRDSSMVRYRHAAPSDSALMLNSNITHTDMKRIKWNFLLVSFLCLCSCADLTELNENPTKATSISPHLLIPTIQLTHSQYLQSTLRYMIFRERLSTTGLAVGVCRNMVASARNVSTIWNVFGQSTIRKLSKLLSP